jgi:hypothetical protein
MVIHNGSLKTVFASSKLKTNSMFFEVIFGFFFLPFKPQLHIIASGRIEKQVFSLGDKAPIASNQQVSGFYGSPIAYDRFIPYLALMNPLWSLNGTKRRERKTLSNIGLISRIFLRCLMAPC